MNTKVLLTLWICLAIPSTSFSQNTNNPNDEVTLVVSADGATKEEATKVALRSAIEQAYGTFVSANTTILNDDLVKDEIVTISNGNIKNYEEVASAMLPNGKQSVTLKATVCISKLVSYAQSKGASTEFAGATFAMNMKMKELNKKNEMVALENLLVQIKELLPYAYDRELIVSEPKMVDDSFCEIEFIVKYKENNNTKPFYDLIIRTLYNLSLTDIELKEMGKLNIQFWRMNFHSPISIKIKGRHNYDRFNGNRDFDLYFRNGLYEWKRRIQSVFERELLNFVIINNLGGKFYPKGTATASRAELGDENQLHPWVCMRVKISKDEIAKYTNFTVERKE